jgi:hypothetical protein
MILYTNGDSHTAAAEAVNTFAFAEDDRLYFHLRRKPHPDNLAVSWTVALSNFLKMAYHTDAESASSNDRIIRTTKEWIENTKDTVEPQEVLMIIQWSTWEREEWVINGEKYQVNASGIDEVPDECVDQYKQWIADINWDQKTYEAFLKIINFHEELNELGYEHIFFNGNNCFFNIKEEDRYDFGKSYIEPYLPEGTYDGWLQNNGFDKVITSNYHYGQEAHAAWAKHLLQHIIKYNMV